MFPLVNSDHDCMEVVNFLQTKWLTLYRQGALVTNFLESFVHDPNSTRVVTRRHASELLENLQEMCNKESVISRINSSNTVWCKYASQCFPPEKHISFSQGIQLNVPLNVFLFLLSLYSDFLLFSQIMPLSFMSFFYLFYSFTRHRIRSFNLPPTFRLNTITFEFLVFLKSTKSFFHGYNTFSVKTQIPTQ